MNGIAEFCAYRLPDGRIVDVDASAAKDARIIGFTLADGTVVDAIQAGSNHPDYRTYPEPIITDRPADWMWHSMTCATRQIGQPVRQCDCGALDGQ